MRKRTLVAIAMIVLAAIGIWWARRFIEQDKCLDRDGRWNPATSECEGGSR